MKNRLFIFMALALSTAGCGATQSNQDGGRETGGSCSPGKQVNCGCSVGRGVQVCKDDGSGYGTCQCGDGGADGGKDGGGDSPMESGSETGAKDAPTDTPVKDTGPKDSGPLTGALVWDEVFAGAAPTAIGVDSLGNIFLIGAFTSSVNFGTGLLTSDGGADTFLVKFNSSGTALWSKAFGNSSSGPTGLAVTPSGSVVIAGVFGSTMNLGCGTMTAGSDGDLYLATFSGSGACVWSKAFTFGGSAFFSNSGLAVDASGNIVAAGRFDGNVNFGTGVLTSPSANQSMYLVRFDSSGKAVWSEGLWMTVDSGFASAWPVGPALDSAGNIVLAGYFSGTLDLGGGHVLSAPGPRVLAAKFDTSGAVTWANAYGSDSLDKLGTGLAVDSAGNVFLSGGFQGTLDFGPGAMTATSGSIFVAKLDSSGTGLWSKKFGDDSDLVIGPQYVAVDVAGNTSFGGGFHGNADFGGGVLVGPSLVGGDFPYVAKLTGSGGFGWQYGGDNFGAPVVVATDALNEVVLTGVVGGTPLHLGGATYSSIGLFLMKFKQ